MVAQPSGARHSAGGKEWIVYAIGSAVFAACVSILGKLGIEGVESNLGVAIRTSVVLVMAWVLVAVQKRRDWSVPSPGRNWMILLSVAPLARPGYATTGRFSRGRSAPWRPLTDERTCHRRLFLFLPPRTAEPQGRRRAACDDRGDRDDGTAVAASQFLHRLSEGQGGGHLV